MGRKAESQQHKDAKRKFFSAWARQIKAASGLSARCLEIEFSIGQGKDGDGRVWRAWMEGTRIPRFQTYLRMNSLAIQRNWVGPLSSLKGAQVHEETKDEELQGHFLWTAHLKEEAYSLLVQASQQWAKAGGTKQEFIRLAKEVFELLPASGR